MSRVGESVSGRKNPRRMIGVIGAADGSASELKMAREVGREIARCGFVLVCGGLEGVMEAACRGACEEGGMTIGILPGTRRSDANAFVDIPIITGMGHARNLLIVQTAGAVVALPGGAGTLSEVALALKVGTPVIALGAWSHIDGVQAADTPAEAVRMAAKLAGKS